jgi:orotate phosphoribosyltransferase
MAPRHSASGRLADRVRAFKIIKELSFARGSFVLASGQKSDTYLDMKPTMFNPEGATLLANMVLERIKDMKVDYVGGLEMGAVPLVSTVAMFSYERHRPVQGMFVRKLVKDHGTKKRIEAAGDIAGKNIVILEDVTTTGKSAMEAVEVVRAAGAKVLLVLSIVDRDEGAAEFYKEQGIPFDRFFRLEEFVAATD